MNIGIIGDGKMGRAVAALAGERGHNVVAVLGLDNVRGRQIREGALADADVAIEFTQPDAAPDNVLACVDVGLPIVVGTTGWYDRLDEVRSAVMRADEVGARRAAVLWAPNFSAGVALFTELVARAGQLFADAAYFDAHLIETHHATKKDAPSGTAAALARVFSRGGRSIEVTSVRTGHVPGTHELLFDGQFEQVRLVHMARDRRVFADGALRAAEWLHGRHGVFTMRDVLGLTTERNA
jgi:4-hydroxy-tetrahydrodipicolinate reductase